MVSDFVITSDDILGKEAVDPSGRILGIVIKLHINKGEKALVGITIDQGFFKSDLFIGIDFVHQFGVNIVLLNSVPMETFKGYRVFSERGRYLGRVREIVTENQKIKDMIISYYEYPFLGKNFRVSSNLVKEIGMSVILKHEAEELLDMVLFPNKIDKK